MVRRATLLTAILAGIAILVSTGAVPLDPGTDGVGPHDEIHIETNDTPYAYLEDGEAVIHIGPGNPNIEAGVNPRAKSVFDHVLTLENNDSEPVAIWIEDVPAGITFLGADGTPLTASDPAHLPPDGAIEVGLRVDTEETVTIDAGSFTIAAEGLADDDGGTGGDTDGSTGDGGTTLPAPVVDPEKVPGVLNISVVTDEQADPLVTDFTALEVGNGTAAITAVEPYVGPVLTVLQLDAEPLTAVNTSTLPQGEPIGVVNITPQNRPNDGIDAMSVRFAVDTATLDGRLPELYHRDNGSWVPLETSVLERSEGTVLAEATTYGFSPFVIGTEAPPLTVHESTISDERIRAGQSLRVMATIANNGTLNTSTPIPLTIDGEVYDRTTADIPANGTTTVTLQTVIEQPGTHDLFVNGNHVGTVTVQPRTETSATLPSDAGLLLGLTIVTILVVSLLRRRR